MVESVNLPLDAYAWRSITVSDTNVKCNDIVARVLMCF